MKKVKIRQANATPEMLLDEYLWRKARYLELKRKGVIK